MTLQWPGVGAGDVGSYLVAGIPWVTSSALAAGEVRHISLPYVTKFIHVRNTGLTGSFALGFTLNGVNGNPTSETHFVTLNATSSNPLPVLELRVKDIFLRTISAQAATFEIVAGLTQIPDSNFPILTGSVTSSGELFDGVG